MTDRARKLRQAISIAIDFEEHISIFENGRGIAAQGPMPPGIFGYRRGRGGINPVVYDWVTARKCKPIEIRRLLAEAGYPGGVDSKTENRCRSITKTAALAGKKGRARLDAQAIEKSTFS